jgi:hypothetical protein
VIVIIQCASGKQPHAGMMRRQDGKPVLFVGDPPPAPYDRFAYARPDDLSDSGETWRDKVLRYNAAPGTNPLGLLPACGLYTAPIYRRLADHVGRERLYILSAGWGLIAASFLTPLYDITFSAQAEAYKRRRQRDVYDDLCMLPLATDEPVLFFGGKEYLPLFCRLTQDIAAPRIVPYRSTDKPVAVGVTFTRFETSRRTNWHYECAQAFIDGSLSLPGA